LKKKQNILSLEQARTLVLREQRLLNPILTKGKKGALSVIEQLGYLQIDTLSVVARSHHHTLWSRLPDYREPFLNELLEKDKSIFEYWSHAASYLPMADYRYSLPVKKLYADGKSHWFAQDKKMNRYVLDKIKAEGPLQSKDFEFKREDKGNWYNWKPAKQALEQLFMEGKLMVARRQNFQKVYDLAERVVPGSIDTTLPDRKEYAAYLIRKAIQAYGISSESELNYLRKGWKEVISSEVKRMLKTGELISLNIETLKDTYLTTPEKVQSLIPTTLLSGKDTLSSGIMHFLSPFDNVVIQRKRLNNLFGFDYNIECYVPEPKRKYGYWCLPLLYNNTFVARFDPKADRAGKVFYIKSMHFEKTFSPNELFNEAFTRKLKEFATFNGCKEIVIQKADKTWKKKIISMLK
jgi:uncharacterized protein YcaQ